MSNAQKKLALAAIFAFGAGCGPVTACGLLTSWTPQCQQEKQQAAVARKFKVDEICIKLGFQPKTPRWVECYNYVNGHLNSQ